MDCVRALAHCTDEPDIEQISEQRLATNDHDDFFGLIAVVDYLRHNVDATVRHRYADIVRQRRGLGQRLEALTYQPVHALGHLLAQRYSHADLLGPLTACKEVGNNVVGITFLLQLESHKQTLVPVGALADLLRPRPELPCHPALPYAAYEECDQNRYDGTDDDHFSNFVLLQKLIMLLYIGLGFIVVAIVIAITGVLTVKGKNENDGKHFFEVLASTFALAIWSSSLLSVGVILLVVAGVKSLI